MSYFVYLKLKPGSSDSGLEQCYRERNDQCYPKKLVGNLYFLGDGHSSHSLVSDTDLNAKSVRLASEAIEIIQAFYRKGQFPSFAVRYETGPPIIDIDSKPRMGIRLSDLTAEFWCLEDHRYFFNTE